MNHPLPLAAALLWTALCAPAGGARADEERPPPADEPDGTAPDDAAAPARPDVRVRLLGGYRVGMAFAEPFAIDPDGTVLDQRTRFEHRLRVAPQLVVGEEFEAFGEIDLFTGLLGGTLTDATVVRDERRIWDATGMRTVELRRLGVAFRPVGAEVRVGLDTDHWGLGAVAGDGGPPGAGFDDDPFGTDAFGDQLIRVAVGFRPAPPEGRESYTDVDLMLDVVARDEDTRLVRRGDLAMGPSLRVRSFGRSHDLGAWLGWRALRSADGATGEHAIGDVYVDLRRPLGAGDTTLRIAAELAGRVGRTATSNGWTTARRDVLAGGAFGELELDAPAAWLGGGVRGGVASADGDPLDGRQTDFAFDRDLDAGVLLFDEVLAGVAARAATELGLLTGAETAPLAHEGAIGGAGFVQPWLAFRPAAVVELRVGGVIASAIVPPATLRATAGRPGGEVPFEGERFLGGELDAAVELELPLVPAVQTRSRFGLRLEYAHLFPGPALTDGWAVPVAGVDRLAIWAGLTF